MNQSRIGSMDQCTWMSTVAIWICVKLKHKCKNVPSQFQESFNSFNFVSTDSLLSNTDECKLNNDGITILIKRWEINNQFVIGENDMKMKNARDEKSLSFHAITLKTICVWICRVVIRIYSEEVNVDENYFGYKSSCYSFIRSFLVEQICL